MRRGAPPRVLDDATALNGPRIDVDVRVGWVLRTARHLGPAGLRMRDIADRLEVSGALVHRVETGAVRSGRVTSGYERILSRPPGSLRAPVDALCRGFPYGSPDRDPGPAVESVALMSALTERVGAVAPGGGDWLDWGRALGQPGAIGLPLDWAATLVSRLAGELNRAVGPAYISRYEALALLRCGPYGDVVLDVARTRLADPHVQVLFDLMSAVGERATPAALQWCLDLLRDPRDRVVTGAALALENMSETSGDADFWSPLVDPLLAVYNDAAEGTAAWRWLSHLLRLVQPAQLAAATRRPVRAPAPLPRVRDASRPAANEHWQEAQRLATVVAEAAGLGHEPMLARLLFEIVHGPQETRAVSSWMLLSGLPELATEAAEQVACVVETHPDPVIAARAARRLNGLVNGRAPAAAHRWLRGDDPRLRQVALMLAGAEDLDLPEALLSEALVHDPAAALNAAGLAGHPIVARWAAEAESEDVRAAARWWLREGTRVTDRAAPDPS